MDEVVFEFIEDDIGREVIDVVSHEVELLKSVDVELTSVACVLSLVAKIKEK